MRLINILILLLVLSGCATVDSKKDKINTIAQEEVKKEYKLPQLTSCLIIEKFTGLTFEEFYTYNKLLKEQYKQCNDFNEEKIEWFQRNFKEEVKK